MFEAIIFLAGPSRHEEQEMDADWGLFRAATGGAASAVPANVYVADGGLDSFLAWADKLDEQSLARIRSVVWCGDGDSLGKHAKEILGHTAARFEGRWREHFYQTDKDFSDCAAIVALIEHDVRHASEDSGSCWLRVHGALAGRYDHELANLLEFSAMLARLSYPAVVQLGPTRAMTTAALRLNIESGRQFSLLPAFANQSCAVRISGARYSGEVFLRQPSHGISNSALSGPVDIEPISTSVPIIVILP